MNSDRIATADATGMPFARYLSQRILWRQSLSAKPIMSLRLREIVTQGFDDDTRCFVSKDFGGHENLVMIELENGDTWLIVFCFQPLKEGVVMEILSTHPKSVRGKPKRGHLMYFARKCLFQQERVPKN